MRSISSSSISSLSAAIASTPMDVVRTRLMNQKHLLALNDTNVAQNIYRGSFHCAIEVSYIFNYDRYFYHIFFVDSTP